MTPKDMPNLSSMQDEELVPLVRDGNTGAFDMLFERYRSRIFSFVRRYVGNVQAAEDIFQRTFVRLYTKASSFKQESRFSTWLYTIAANLCKDELKKRRVRKHVSIDSRSTYGEGGGFAPTLGERMPDGTPGQRSQLDARAISVAVRKAIDDLPEEFRTVAVLHGLHGLKYREVAEVLGIPVGTVQSRMHTALTRLRQELRLLGPKRK